MRVLLLLAAFLGLIWLAVPMGFNKASDASPQATSATAQADLRQASQAMRNAANRLENSPCDQNLRPPLRAAVVAFLRARPDRYAPMSEEEHEIVTQATMAGVVRAEDLLGPFAFLAQKPQSNAAAGFNTAVFADKYACHNSDDPR